MKRTRDEVAKRGGEEEIKMTARGRIGGPSLPLKKERHAG